MNRINWRFSLAWILSLAATGCVVHPHPGSHQAPRHEPPPPSPTQPREIVAVVPHVQAEDPRLAQCRRDNYQEHAQAMQIYHRAQQAGNISPDEAQRFAAADQQLRQYAAQLGRNGLTLAECDAIGRQIAEQQALVRRMASSHPGYRPYQGDPALMQCRADVRRANAETTQLYHRARASGEISPHEARQFSDMEQRMTRHAQSAARDGLTLRECESLLREANHEHDQVERMASNRRGDESAPVPRKFAHEPQSPLAQCSANSQEARDKTRQLYARAHATGSITPMEQETFEKTEQRLDKMTQELQRGGLTLPECEALAREIAEQNQRVERMAGTRSRTSSR